MDLNAAILLQLSVNHVQVFPILCGACVAFHGPCASCPRWGARWFMLLQLSIKHLQGFPTHSAECIMLLQLSVTHIQVSPTQKADCVLQLSMDHVQVFPDGELNVQAAANRDTSPSFVRPISKAGQHRPRNITEVPKPHRCIPHLTHPRRLCLCPRLTCFLSCCADCLSHGA